LGSKGSVTPARILCFASAATAYWEVTPQFDKNPQKGETNTF
jgi:hypothetical protein